MTLASGAWIAPKAHIPASAKVFPTAWVGPAVTLGEGVVVGPGAVLGYGATAEPLRIGAGSSIGPHVYVAPGVEIGEECVIGMGTAVSDGVRIGSRARIGIRCTLMEHCRIGDSVFLASEVYICEHAELQPHCQILPRVILLNMPYPPTVLGVTAPVIGECAIICVNAVIWPGVKVGYHAMVAGSSEVKNNVADYMLVRGCPAAPICDVRQIRAKIEDQWVFPYPWMRQLIPGEDITQPATPPRRAKTVLRKDGEGDRA